MTPEEFRRHGHEIVDWIADYWQEIESRRVVPSVHPGEVRAALPRHAPEAGESFASLMADFEQIIMPGMSHWGHPGWFAYFPANASPPSVLAEMLTAGLGAQCMSWITSPAATELEQTVMIWLRELLGVPEQFTGVIQDTASSATLVAFLTARNEGGGDATRMTAYWSTEAHSSVAKAARLTGIAPEHCRVVPVDDEYAMRPDALAAMIAADRAAGLRPGIVVASVGTTSSTACDPLRTIGTVAREAAAWFHVDGAYGGTAAILPEVRPLFDGLDLADSYVTNPHKWLMTSFDCTAYYVRDVAALLRAFSANPEYLRMTLDDEVVNYRDYGIPLGRRFRALKLWFVLRSYGVAGLRDLLRSHLAMAHEFATWVDATPGWERLAPHPFGLVCCRSVPAAMVGDEPALAVHNAALLARVNASGRVFLTHTTLSGRYTLRMAIGQFRTEPRHVREAWELLQEAARQLTP